jgi:hypothetical protein
VFLTFFRTGDFITLERAKLWAAALLIGFVLAVAGLFVTAHGLSDYHGRPLGTDFSDIYVAGQSALSGDAISPFNPERQRAHEQALFGKATPFYGWHYPPFFLLIAEPLAHLPYIPALIVWQLATLALYLGAIALILRKSAAPQLCWNRTWLLLALAFPAVFVNLTHGHNGFLTAALVAGALALLDDRPILAGILFGLLAYKPQFGLLIPIALLAEMRWRTIAAAALTVAVLAATVTVLFGAGVWHAFLESTAFTRSVVLEDGGAGFFKIQSVFAWVRMWGGPVPLAYLAQGVVTLTMAAAVFGVWRSDASREIKGALLCIAALLATPYSLDYDMMVLAPAIALMIADGVARGIAPYQKAVIAGLWLIPFVARPFAGATSIPLGVPMMLAAAVYLAAPILLHRPRLHTA